MGVHCGSSFVTVENTPRQSLEFGLNRKSLTILSERKIEDAGGLIEFQECKQRFCNTLILQSGKCITHTGSWCDTTAVFIVERSTKTLREWIHSHTHGSLWRWSQFTHLGKDRSQSQNMGRNKALVGLLGKCRTERKTRPFTHSGPSPGLQRQHLGELTLRLLTPAITHSDQVKTSGLRWSLDLIFRHQEVF